MTEIQERAVIAMRAIGDTVTGAPALRLPPRTAPARSPLFTRLAGARFTRLSGPAGRAWRLWLVPSGAAVAVVALAVSLTVMRSAPEDSAILPGPGASAPAGSSGAATGPGGVPPYYVTLAATFGWYAYAPPTPQANAKNVGLIVGETASGKQLATVPTPHGMTFNVVTGAADDRTFVVGATSYQVGEKTVSTYWPESWYLLRIAPGTAHVAQLTRLPMPKIPYVTGVALSPDGTELAVASKNFNVLGGSSTDNPPQLSLWSVATGKEGWQWGTQSGWITASVPAANSRPGPLDINGMATALRWTPDGGALAFAWNGTEIRLIDFTAQGPGPNGDKDLIKASRLRAGIGLSATPAGASFTCDAIDGWSISTGGKTFDCAGSVTPMQPATGPGCGKTAPAHQAIFQQISLPGGAGELTTLAQSPACTDGGDRTLGASLGWSSADGSTVIARLSDGWLSGDNTDEYGIYAKNKFTALPALPGGMSPAWVAW